MVHHFKITTTKNHQNKKGGMYISIYDLFHKNIISILGNYTTYIVPAHTDVTDNLCHRIK